LENELNVKPPVDETKLPEPVIIEVEKPKNAAIILDDNTKQFYIKENIEIE